MRKTLTFSSAAYSDGSFCHSLRRNPLLRRGQRLLRQLAPRQQQLKKRLVKKLLARLKAAGEAEEVYPDGTMTIYAYGQPQYLQIYFDDWLERNRDIAPGVSIEIVQTQDVNDAREKISMTYLVRRHG